MGTVTVAMAVGKLNQTFLGTLKDKGDPRSIDMKELEGFSPTVPFREQVIAKAAGVDLVSYAAILTCSFARRVKGAGATKLILTLKDAENIFGVDTFEFEEVQKPLLDELQRIDLLQQQGKMPSQEEALTEQMRRLYALIVAALPGAKLKVTLSKGILETPLEFEFAE